MKKVILFIFSLSFLFAQEQMPPVPVKAFTINNEKVKISKSFPATIKPYSDVNIIARVSGTIQKRYFKEGQKVKKGDLLYKIEQDSYLASLNEAKARLRQAQAALTKASKDWKRYKKLYEKKSISAYTKDEFYYNYQNAQANVENYKAMLKNAQIQYNYTVIKAPINGVISTTNLNVGNVVSTGTVLTNITQTNPVYVEFSLPQKDIAKYLGILKSGKVKLSIKNNGQTFENGKISYISPILDSSTDSLLLKATFENPNSDIIIGQFTDITISDIDIPNVTVIPEQAIFQKETMSLVLVVNKGMASPRPVKTAGMSENGIMVMGLKQGEKIVISNINKVLMGMMKGAKAVKVQVIKPKPQGK